MMIAVLHKRLWQGFLVSLTALGIALPFNVQAETPPPVIRFGSPAGFAKSGIVGGAIVGIANYKGWLDEEFKNDKVRLEYPTFKGGAPIVGQALANKQLDFAAQGDLMSVIGRSAGLQTRLILPSVKMANAYLAVPTQSSIKSIEDLRGKKVAYYKGNYIHLQVIRILAEHGMTEKDIRSIYLDPASTAPALISGDVDAVFGATDMLSLRDKGLARIVYSTRDKPALTAQSGLLVRDEFAQKYPETTARIVKVIVRTAAWMSEKENRAEVFDLWTSDRALRNNVEEDYGVNRPLGDKVSPLMDTFYVTRYQATLDQAAELGLLRGKKFEIEQWFDRRFLNAALKELKLENYWQPLDAKGARAK
ncbi:MAG: ABC transporter substrate-binding protein [Oxalicibacterium faecigallinarum]|uniref:ABC transporter substrate-binding protein n=1 Tax=Oxalicibacterium faecigallinarum TaxID=573741 RepID=UPI002809E844|nr:ABC transporter substrate-binding protein [Oxalicibacterium faecigallinarum]MDQ7969521.1 ABC transporter substrate-binding protein [Oxalicibacterium faecigallinarum]